MSARDHVLVIDDNAEVADAMAMLLERPGLTTFICSDVESAELVLTRHPITHVLTDVQFSGPFAFEGLHFVTRIATLRPSCRIVVMTGYGSEELRRTALRAGAAAVLSKPFDHAELEAALGFGPDAGSQDALSLNDAAAGEYEVVRVAAIDEILGGGLLTTVFQPIVRLQDGAPTMLGFEALTRVRGEWGGGGVLELFDYASRKDRLAELNLNAIGCALAAARQLPEKDSLFLNVDAPTFDRGDLAGILRSGAERNGVALSRIVLEITERSGIGERALTSGALAALRAEGVRFALDDHGSAHSHLGVINEIRPSFIKISHTFGTAFDEDTTRLRIVRHVVGLAQDFGCRTVLEGIETEATARAAATYGIELGQGYHFGRPSAAAHWIAPRVAA